jgi:hypothetical protein
MAATLAGLAVDAAPASETIALVPLELSGSVNVSRADLESAVMKGLAVAGRPVVAPEDAAARAAKGNGEMACQSAACWSRLGTLVEAGYVVAGRAARNGASFEVSFRLVRAADGTTLASEDNQCEVADCSIAELARRSARELVRQTLGRDAPARVAMVQPRVVPEVRATPEPAPPRWRKLLWPAVAVGAASAAVGVWLIAIHGHCVDDVAGECPTLRKTRVGGIAALAGGAALAGTAVYFLLRDDSGARVAVGLGPGSVSVAGRF